MQKAGAGLIDVLCSALLLFTVPGFLPAQTPTRIPSTQSGETKSGTPQSPNAAQQAPSTTNNDLTPIYGLQGVLIETLDGRTVSAQSIDQGFNPASAVKLVTALVALHNLGAQHRFTTGFWTNGSFDKTNGKIQGNLYVS